jgi:hypothetical protein
MDVRVSIPSTSLQQKYLGIRILGQAARAHPAEPAPMMMWLYVGISLLAPLLASA